jgi:hypothetical protein
MKKALKSKKKLSSVITICSSASFYKQVIEVRDSLKKLGFKVLTPLTAGKMERTGDFKVSTYKTWFNDPKTYKRKAFLTMHHFKKVAEGDSLLVLNYDKNGKQGYIGGAVLAEMAVGFFLKKPIYILNPIQEDVSYKEEILGMGPVVLNGDLNKIRK